MRKGHLLIPKVRHIFCREPSVSVDNRGVKLEHLEEGRASVEVACRLRERLVKVVSKVVEPYASAASRADGSWIFWGGEHRS